MKGERGLTLVEVLIALVVLSVGVMAVASLQATALRANSRAEAIRGVTRVAQAELTWQRYSEVGPYTAENPSPIDGASSYAYPCLSILPADFACTFEITPCNLVSDALTCQRDVVSPLAYRIAVTASDARGTSVTLSAVSTGGYVAGTGGDDGLADPPDGSGPPSDPPPAVDPGPEPTPTPPPAPCVPAGKSGHCK